MLGVGGSELVILGLMFLIIFGPNKLPQMARDIGKFVGEARRSIDEFKDELTADADPEEKPARRRESRNGSGSSKRVSKTAKSEKSEASSHGDVKTAEATEEDSEDSGEAPESDEEREKKEEPGLRDL